MTDTVIFTLEIIAKAAIAVVTSSAVTAIGELDLSPILKLVGFHIVYNDLYNNLKCYYDEKCCSCSLSIPILYLAKRHLVNYCSSI